MEVVPDDDDESLLLLRAAAASASTSAHECRDVDSVRGAAAARPLLSLPGGLCGLPPGSAFLAASVKWTPCVEEKEEERRGERRF